MALKKSDVLKEIKDSELFKTYSKVGEETIDREPITQEVNYTGEALTRFHHLQRYLKRASRGPKDAPDMLENDASAIWKLVDKSIMACLSEDGQILPDDFKKFFEPLASMVEGYLSISHEGHLPKMEEVRYIRKVCKEKAFVKQLKRLFESKENANLFTLWKILQSLGTHLVIGMEKKNSYKEGLIESVLWLSSRLQKKAEKGRKDCDEELRVVRSWKLTDNGNTN